MKKILLFIILLSLFTSCARILRTGKLPKQTPAKTPTHYPATGSERPLQLAAGVKRYYLNVNGDNRTFLVQLPEGFEASKSYPVVFAFHAIQGRDTMWVTKNNFKDFVNKNQYIGIYPQGYNGGIWNIGDEHYPLHKVSEPDFVMAIYNWLNASAHVNAKKVYAVGTSNGGLLCHYLAVHTTIFAAIAPISGSLYQGELLATAQPTAVLQTNGQLDKTVPYYGGTTKYGYPFESAEQSVKDWAIHNKCQALPQVERLYNGKVISYAYKNCQSGKPAILYSIPNQGHKVIQEFDTDWLFTQIFSFFEQNPR